MKGGDNKAKDRAYVDGEIYLNTEHLLKMMKITIVARLDCAVISEGMEAHDEWMQAHDEWTKVLDAAKSAKDKHLLEWMEALNEPMEMLGVNMMETDLWS